MFRDSFGHFSDASVTSFVSLLPYSFAGLLLRQGEVWSFFKRRQRGGSYKGGFGERALVLGFRSGGTCERTLDASP